MVPAQVQAGPEEGRLPRRAGGAHLLHGQVHVQQRGRRRIHRRPGRVKEGQAQGLAAVSQEEGQQHRRIINELGHQGKNIKSYNICKICTNKLYFRTKT